VVGNSKGVSVISGVDDGRGVGVSVAIEVAVGVQVGGRSGMRVSVGVGEMRAVARTGGGNGFKPLKGSVKILKKYPPINRVSKKTVAVAIFQIIPVEADGLAGLDGGLSKSKASMRLPLFI
jgi:hypothetical protein